MKTYGLVSIIQLFLILVLFGDGIRSVNAEPYIAQRLGQKCSSCHTNMTGGGKRNNVGLVFGKTLTDNILNEPFSPQLSEQISIGANLRADYNYTAFSDPELADGTPVPDAEIEDTNSFDFGNGAMYLEFAVGSDLSFYLDQQVVPEGGRTREAIMIYKGVFGQSSYLKAGKFYLPFGLRLQDDLAYIRQVTGFNFDNSDIGAEIGYEPGNWSFAMALSNGTQGAGENNTDKQISFTGAYIQPGYRLGASFSDNNGASGTSQTIYNIYGGLTYGDFTFLGEVDKVKNTQQNLEVNQLLSFLSINYLYTPSLNYKLSYEYFDPDENIDEDENTRISLIAEKFLNQYFQLRIGARLFEGIPQNPLVNQDLLFAELHLHF